MSSSIDVSKPTAVQAYTRDVRANFRAARREIIDLQISLTDARNEIAVLERTIADARGEISALQELVDEAQATALAAVRRSGDTMTGLLTLSGDPVDDLDAASKAYVDGQAGGDFLPLEGGTLTGPLTLAADPTAELEAASKQYVDTLVEDLSERIAALEDE